MSNVEFFPTIEPFLSRRETAMVLGVSLRTLDRFVDEGIPSKTWGIRTRVFRASEAIAWLDQRKEAA
jgi:phage terminase Nu1 subunit (DNA packaging protein)